MPKIIYDPDKEEYVSPKKVLRKFRQESYQPKKKKKRVYKNHWEFYTLKKKEEETLWLV